MRAEKDSVRMGIKDLGDQVKTQYAIVFFVPSGIPVKEPTLHVVHVDIVEADEEHVSGYLTTAPGVVREVIRFPAGYNWYMAHSSIVEEVTYAEVLERERENVSYRVQMQKDLNAVHEAAQDGNYVPEPSQTPRQAPKSFEDQLDWLDKMGEQLDEEGPDERKS